MMLRHVRCLWLFWSLITAIYRLNLTLPQRLINQEFALPALTLLETKTFRSGGTYSRYAPA
jgi:hypothetical protein